jgi:large subunit ribosomal protein L24
MAAGKKTEAPTPRKMKFKKGDTVQIITGKDKGRQGKVLEVYPKTGKVVVEDLNIIIRHKKAQPTQNNPNPKSGRLEIAAPILASKVMLVGDDGKPTRVRTQVAEDGTKTRVSTRRTRRA